ncbi:MAG TPA: ABC transporter permease [Acidimicrobiales bacterium]|nr:ABC transporter permease [Acidimicrobiales bacterium]
MSATITIATTELRRVGRDRSNLFFIVALPVLVIVVIGATIGATGGRSEIGVLDLDGSARSAELVDALGANASLEVTAYDDADELAVDVRLDRVRAGVVIPAGYGDALATGTPVAVDMVVDPSRGTTAAARAAVAGVVDGESAVVAAATFTAERAGLEPDAARDRAEAAAASVAPVAVVAEEVGRGGIDAGSPFTYPAAANLVLFTFINTLAVGAVLVESRRLGVARRILAGPVTPTAVVAGFGVSRFLVALVQGALVIALGAWVFDVAWGDPLAATALVVLFALVATGVGVLVGALARSAEQAQSVGIPVAIGLGMLGGAMWPLQFVPDWLRQLGHVTPHAWAMDGWVAVIFDGAGVADIATELAVLAGFAAVLLGVSAVALRRVVTRG